MFQSNGQRFPKIYQMTTGVEFCVKGVPVPNSESTVELQIFDTAGQDIYAEVLPSYWENAEGALLVYDVTRPHTLDACGQWYGRLLESLGKESLPAVLVANKSDLRERLVVTRQQGQQMADHLNVPFFETSALEGVETEKPFGALAMKIREALGVGDEM